MGQLTAFIDLGDIQLAEGAKLTWVHALPIGKKTHPVFGTLDFSKKRLQQLADSVNNKVRRIDPVVDYEHGGDPAKGRIAAGWIKSAEVRLNGLYLGVQFNDAAKKDIKAKHWRYISAEIHNEWEDEDGKKFKDVIVAATLTNRPYMKSLEEFSLVASDDFIESLREEQPGPSSEPTKESDVGEMALLVLLADPNYYDVSFIQDMIRNHASAIEIAAGELRSGADETVREIAKSTIREERAALDKVLDWLIAWDGPKRREMSPLY